MAKDRKLHWCNCTRREAKLTSITRHHQRWWLMANYSKLHQRKWAWRKGPNGSIDELARSQRLATCKTLRLGNHAWHKGETTGKGVKLCVMKEEGHRWPPRTDYCLTEENMTRFNYHVGNEDELKKIGRHTIETMLLLTMRCTTSYKSPWQNFDCRSRATWAEDRMQKCVQRYESITYSNYGVCRKMDVPIYGNSRIIPTSLF